MPKIFTTLDKIKPAYDITYKVVLFICKLLLIADIIITTMSVIGRYVPFIPDPAWSEEVVLTCMSYMAVLSAALAIRRGAHIRMTAFDVYLPKMVVKVLDILADLAVCVLGIIMLVVGYDPIYAYGQLIRGGFGTKLNFGTTLEKITPVLLSGLAFVIGMKGDFFNMGVEGQMTLAAITTAWLGVELFGKMPAALVVIICFAASIGVAMLYALIPALLKAFLNANEICTTILLNYVATLFSTYLCLYPLYGGAGVQQTAKLDSSLLLKYILPPSRANVGIFIAFFAVIAFAFFFKRTRAGFFIQATGENAAYAESIGVKTKQSVIAAVVMSGAVAGLAGVIEVLGVHGRFVNAFAGNIPLYGMLAALISNGSFLSMTIYSTLIGVLQAGSLGMERFTGLSEELINILISMFILFVMMDMKLGKGKKKRKPGKDKTEGGEKA